MYRTDLGNESMKQAEKERSGGEKGVQGNMEAIGRGHCRKDRPLSAMCFTLPCTAPFSWSLLALTLLLNYVAKGKL